MSMCGVKIELIYKFKYGESVQNQKITIESSKT